MFILTAITLLVLNATGIAIAHWLIITACIIGSMELGLYCIALVAKHYGGINDDES